jgi:hypothetical protein
MLFLTFQRDFFQESFYLIVVMLTKMSFVAFYLNIQLLDPHLLWFFLFWFILS